MKPQCNQKCNKLSAAQLPVPYQGVFDMKAWMLAHAGRFGRAAIQLGDDRSGVTMLEYGLIAALIAAVCVGAVTTLGTDINGVFVNVASSI